MTKPLIREHNIETDEVIDREMTDVEFAEYEQKQIEALETQREAEAKTEAKAALLEKLGITQDEAKLLLS